MKENENFKNSFPTMAFQSFLRHEGLIRELLDDEPRDVPFKVSGIRLSKKKPRRIKWRRSFSSSSSSSSLFPTLSRAYSEGSWRARKYASRRYAGNSRRNREYLRSSDTILLVKINFDLWHTIESREM